MSHFPGFFVQSHDVLDVETIYLFSCVNILSEIIEEFLKLDLIEFKWNKWKNLSGQEITRLKTKWKYCQVSFCQAVVTLASFKL